jgi:adenine-specific DNA-methyltransferase
MSHRRDPNPRLKQFAREMRREPTDAERKLWFILRDRRLGGFKFRRQHPVGGYIVDFFCMEARLGVEADGGQHYDPEGKAYDDRRSQVLTELGVEVLRFSDYEVIKHSDAVARTIFRRLTEPSPYPLPEYRERERGDGRRSSKPIGL